MIRKVVIILSVVFLIAISIVLDFTFQRFGKLNQGINHGLYPIIPFGTEIVVYVILAILLINLAWVVLYRNQRSYPTAIALILLGALVLFTMSPLVYFFINSFFKNKFTWYSDSVISMFSFTRNTATMILVIGLTRLLPNKKLWSNP